MLIIIAAVVLIAAALLLGIWLGRSYCRPLPQYQERLTKQIEEIDKQLRSTQATMKRNFDEELAAYKVAKQNAIEKEITIATNEKNSLGAAIESKKNELKNIQNSIQDWESSIIHQKIRIIKNTKEKRQQELDALNEEYDLLMSETKAAMGLIEDRLREWSTAERAAYEERIGREETAKRNRLLVSSRSIEELQELYGACNKLKLANPTPLYKAIYELYFRGPVKELGVRIGVVGKCGIYKITNVLSGKVYIGQSVDIAERWKQHVKRGTKCEVGTISGAGLYDAMYDEGVWNFSFEMLEECERAKLNEREKFWIQYFQSNEIGYNQKL